MTVKRHFDYAKCWSDELDQIVLAVYFHECGCLVVEPLRQWDDDAYVENRAREIGSDPDGHAWMVGLRPSRPGLAIPCATRRQTVDA